MEKTKIKWFPIAIGGIIQVILTLIMTSAFAVIMNVAEIDYKFSPVFGSVAVAIGGFANAFYLSKKRGNKGYLLGLAVGLITFIIITLVGLVLNDGGLTINTLFHLIIFLLSSVTGGIIGVNKKGEKYV